MNPKQHWDAVYATKAATDVSWFQPEARLSLELIQAAVPERSAAILDVGGGASLLVDGLLAAGYRALSVLDISAAALEQARTRLGARAVEVAWLDADVLSVQLPAAAFDMWHDRAVFHFLTAPSDRRRYLDQVRHAVCPGGHVVVATFAEDGPTRCSGLEVARYSAEALTAELGTGFRLLRSRREDHLTPSGSRQRFTYCLWRYEP
ncbi:MAG: class I SAM-dependent methyltransferase [Gemmatimonadota bacterium]